MTTKLTRYTFKIREPGWRNDDPHWVDACAPRKMEFDAQAEAHARWLAIGQPVRITRGGISWTVASPRDR